MSYMEHKTDNQIKPLPKSGGDINSKGNDKQKPPIMNCVRCQKETQKGIPVTVKAEYWSNKEDVDVFVPLCDKCEKIIDKNLIKLTAIVRCLREK